MEENRLQMDDVCIEEDEAIKEMREIYKTMDCIKTKRVAYSLEDAIKKLCCTENMPQNVRRSERIQMKLIQKEYDLASQLLTYKPISNKATTSQKKVRTSSKKKPKSFKNAAPSSLVGPTSRSSNKKHHAKIPERILEVNIGDGNGYIVVKWKRKEQLERIYIKDLTDNLRKLTMSFLHSRLSGNENSFQEENHASLVRGNSACHETEEHVPIVRGSSACHETEEHVPIVRENPVCQEREECVPMVTDGSVYQEREEHALCENREDYYPVSQADEWHINSNCTVKSTIPIDVPSLHLQKINTLSFKRQQKLFIQESCILDEYKACSLDIKLNI